MTWFRTLMPPYTQPGEILLFNLAVAALLVWILLLFRRARPWPPAWRGLAQAPGWLLVIIGACLSVGLARMELQEKRGGLGLGICVAMISATIKAAWLAYGRPDSETKP